MGQRRAEERHEPITQELVHGALEPVHGLQSAGEERIEYRVHAVCPESICKWRRTDDVAEQDRDLLAFTFERATGAEDLFGEMSGCIPQGGLL